MRDPRPQLDLKRGGSTPTLKVELGVVIGNDTLESSQLLEETRRCKYFTLDI